MLVTMKPTRVGRDAARPWRRPDLTAYRDPESAYRIGLKSLARRYLELHDEIADLDAMIAAIVDE
jgi:transposase